MLAPYGDALRRLVEIDQHPNLRDAYFVCVFLVSELYGKDYKDVRRDLRALSKVKAS
ncbi:hypothetical protein [Pseudogemmobacter humi]|uniref:Uncharacterized protein n=1 Tax=Pseudogemmobacter humi TaxID=2483812 RepID=A0A3P5XB91_9RHOB|nr:hypothetical protein [Pseudogemmobacter humi]VDC31841.1 hypothetical protein XINFAN_03187 [Pseudogemmobacter humi]